MEPLALSPKDEEKLIKIRDIVGLEEVLPADDESISELVSELVPVTYEKVDETVSKVIASVEETVPVVCEKVASAVEKSVNTVEAEVVEAVKSSSCWGTSWASWWRRSRALPATSKVLSSQQTSQ